MSPTHSPLSQLGRAVIVHLLLSDTKSNILQVLVKIYIDQKYNFGKRRNWLNETKLSCGRAICSVLMTIYQSPEGTVQTGESHRHKVQQKEGCNRPIKEGKHYWH